MSKITKNILVLSSFVIFFSITQVVTSLFLNNREDKATIKVEKTNFQVPTSTSLGTGGPEPPEELNLLEGGKVYQPSSNVFDDYSIYDKESKDLALIGTFASAEFQIEGDIKNKNLNFLSVNIGNVSGIYGVSRVSRDRLSYNNTNAIFTKKNPLRVNINLLSTQTRLSSTDKELDQGLLGYKDLYLWRYIQPPPETGTVVRVLFVPFDKDGIIGDTSLSKLKFLYRCKEKNSCAVALCEKGVMGSVCLEKNFGKESSKEYVKYFKKTIKR